MTINPEQDEVIQNLIDGYKTFHSRYFAGDESTLYQDLVRNGQSPKVMIIACSDSRVDPGTILNCAPGEVFTVRNVANLVPPCQNDDKHHGTSAALEFAVRFLKVDHIIVLGHSYCGGIRALLSKTDNSTLRPDFISNWMDIARDAKHKALAHYESPELQEQHCCEYSLIASLHNLHTFPWIAERVAAGNLKLHAWHFDLATGKVKCYNAKTQQFAEMV